MVKAIIEKRVTTIDNDTGEIRRDVAGTVKGFGDGLRQHIMKGQNVAQTVGAHLAIGQLPPGHAEEGKWCVQINLLAFDKKEYAEEMADRVLPIIEGILGTKAVTQQ